jgi:hypothetical protein
MSRIINCARTGLAAGAVTLLMSHATFAAQINIHVPTPVIHLPPPTVRVLVPDVHVKTPKINVGTGSNHPLEGGVHGLVSRDNQNALKSTNRQIQKDINNSDASTLLSKQTSTIRTPMRLGTAPALQDPANGGSPSGGGGTGWSELAALLGKGRIYSAFSLNPSLPTTYPGAGGASFYSGAVPLPVPNPNAQGGYDTVNTVLSGGRMTSRFQLWPIQQDLQGDLDSMNEMSEMTSMRLQMAMDRRSKFVETLSNMLKKIDGTQEAIIQNMK